MYPRIQKINDDSTSEIIVNFYTKNQAIEINKDTGKATVTEVLCHGCGICNAECPTGAIQLRSFKDIQLLAQLEALMGE